MVNQAVQGLANAVGEVGSSQPSLAIFYFENICYIKFGIVMLKIYFAAKQAFDDDFCLRFIELLTVDHAFFKQQLPVCYPFYAPPNTKNHFLRDANQILESALVYVQSLATVVSFYS